MSDTTSRGVRVEVRTAYVPERSSPADSQYFFAYRIRISNVGDETVQLLSRHWIISDGEGNEEHVRGPGVVGEQPVLEPGEAFEYTSFCPLPTPFGTMHGTYLFKTEDGSEFDAEIGQFTLVAPGAVN